MMSSAKCILCLIYYGKGCWWLPANNEAVYLQLEAADVALCDEFYEEYSNLMVLPDDSSRPCYKTYCLKNSTSSADDDVR